MLTMHADFDGARASIQYEDAHQRRAAIDDPLLLIESAEDVHPLWRRNTYQRGLARLDTTTWRDGIDATTGMLTFPMAGIRLSIGWDRTCPRPTLDSVLFARALRDGSLGVPSPRVLDVGCGTGILGIAAAVAYGARELTLIDINPSALATAAANVERNRQILGDCRVVYKELDAVRWLSDAHTSRFDLLVSSPPYFQTALHTHRDRDLRTVIAAGLASSVAGLWSAIASAAVIQHSTATTVAAHLDKVVRVYAHRAALRLAPLSKCSSDLAATVQDWLRRLDGTVIDTDVVNIESRGFRYLHDVETTFVGNGWA